MKALGAWETTGRRLLVLLHWGIWLGFLIKMCLPPNEMGAWNRFGCAVLIALSLTWHGVLFQSEDKLKAEWKP